MTKAEKARMQAIAELGCIVCMREGNPETPAEIHHIRSDVGIGQRSTHVLPLCSWHHRLGGYSQAIHAGRRVWEDRFGTELELVEAVEKLLDSN